MESLDHERRRVRKKSFKERLGLKTIACCGGTWGLNSRNQDPEDQEVHSIAMQPQEMTLTSALQSPQGNCMNLAAALAAERHLRATQEPEKTPLKVSLLRLLEEKDGRDGEVVSDQTMCCVCMGRKKGAAFIPCGHTFCRVCSRELWLNRGSCPLCNRSILEILDIF